MKRSFLVPLILSVVSGAFAQSSSGPGRSAADAPPVAADAFDWLEGEWMRETRHGTAVESWVRVSDGTMEGVGGIASGDGIRVTEHLRLERFGDEVFYVAKPGENPYPTAFKLVEAGTTDEGHPRFLFENPEHDFPQRILYVREGEDGLLARIEGTMGGEERGIDFRFRRAH